MVLDSYFALGLIAAGWTLLGFRYLNPRERVQFLFICIPLSITVFGCIRWTSEYLILQNKAQACFAAMEKGFESCEECYKRIDIKTYSTESACWTSNIRTTSCTTYGAGATPITTPDSSKQISDAPGPTGRPQNPEPTSPIRNPEPRDEDYLTLPDNIAIYSRFIHPWHPNVMCISIPVISSKELLSPVPMASNTICYIDSDSVHDDDSATIKEDLDIEALLSSTTIKRRFLRTINMAPGIFDASPMMFFSLVPESTSATERGMQTIDIKSRILKSIYAKIYSALTPLSIEVIRVSFTLNLKLSKRPAGLNLDSAIIRSLTVQYSLESDGVSNTPSTIGVLFKNSSLGLPMCPKGVKSATINLPDETPSNSTTETQEPMQPMTQGYLMKLVGFLSWFFGLESLFRRLFGIDISGLPAEVDIDIPKTIHFIIEEGQDQLLNNPGARLIVHGPPRANRVIGYIASLPRATVVTTWLLFQWLMLIPRFMYLYRLGLTITLVATALYFRVLRMLYDPREANQEEAAGQEAAGPERAARAQDLLDRILVVPDAVLMAAAGVPAEAVRVVRQVREVGNRVIGNPAEIRPLVIAAPVTIWAWIRQLEYARFFRSAVFWSLFSLGAFWAGVWTLAQVIENWNTLLHRAWALGWYIGWNLWGALQWSYKAAESMLSGAWCAFMCTEWCQAYFVGRIGCCTSL